MSIDLDIQRDVSDNSSDLPSDEEFHLWVETVLSDQENSELTIRLCNVEEISSLNETYRQKTGSTNVLSFPAELPEELNLPLLGDIVICASVVEKEAEEQKKSLEAHWAHMVVHGVLHLLGYDHVEEDEAEIMEEKEINILSKLLGYKNPYSVMESI